MDWSTKRFIFFKNYLFRSSIRVCVICSHNKYAYIHIYMFMQHPNDTIIRQTHNDEVARINDARKEDTGRLLYKIFYLSSLFVSFERVVQSLHVRGSWRPNITEIFWPQSYGRQRCVFLVLHGCSTGPWSKLFCVLAFPTTRVYLRLLLYCLPSFSPISPGSLNSTDRNSTRRPYITFKLPRADMDTPPRLLPISGDWDVSLPLSLEWPVWSSSSGNKLSSSSEVTLFRCVSLWEYNGIFFTSSHFISQFPPTRFPLITATRMCHSFRCITLNGIFGQVNRSKHNNPSLIIFQNSTCGIFFTFVSITLTHILQNNLQGQ